MTESVLGFAIIVALFLLGDFLHHLGVPIPGGVLGLLIFHGGLQTGLIKLKWVNRSAGFLLRHMVLLFIPLTVGLVSLGNLLARQAWAICTSLVLSFLAVLLVTGLLGNWLLPSPDDAAPQRTTS
jgi:holin-like protein